MDMSQDSKYGPLKLRLQRALGAVLLAAGLLLLGFRGAPPAASTARAISVPGGIPAWSLRVVPAPVPSRTPRLLFRIPVTVTGYSSTPDQTDDTPFVTAANTRVRRGVIALSRDLLREFTPGAPFAFGDLLEIEGVGTFRVEDTMAERYRQRADIWFSTRTAARQWGRRHLSVARLTPDADQQEPGTPLPLFEAALAD
jgi:3D (Asp-Asp-Asp) domain-containing protein